MRSSTALLVLAFAPLLAACADDPNVAFDDVADDASEEGGGGAGGSFGLVAVEGMDGSGSLALDSADGSMAAQDDDGSAALSQAPGGRWGTMGAPTHLPPPVRAVTLGASEPAALSGDGATGGSVVPPASDACPGEAHAITLGGSTVVIDGDTTGATDALETCWSVDVADDGADSVYAFELPSAGVFMVQLDSLTAGYQPVLVVRDVCDQRDGEYCHDGGTTKQVHKAAHAAGTVYVGVDSPGTTTGTFRLIATLVAESCGDGLVSGTEECDAGKAQANDGCGDPGQPDACLITSPQNSDFDDCAFNGEPVNVPSGTSSLTGLTMTTNGYLDDYKGTCMPETGGADRVFRLVPGATGTLEVRAGFDDPGTAAICAADYTAPGCFDVELYARSTCASADPADEIACKSDCCNGETMTFPVTSGTPVYLFVDGYDAEWYSRGPFNLHFNLVP